ncbi:MAG: MarR family EPS-associated transcriptional regulator [Candidatus Omnitrophica bacterium]|nr:MarR family EPS-associated transcriptional regulator [Candidatus Omnitrophota bacterium]
MFEQSPDKKNNGAAELEREEILNLLSELHKTPDITQREMSLRLDVSLGKVNYLLNALIKRGLLSIKNFSKNEGKVKLKRVKYNLTKKGFQEKLKLTYHFLKKKEKEFNRLCEEWEDLKNLSETLQKAGIELEGGSKR